MEILYEAIHIRKSQEDAVATTKLTEISDPNPVFIIDESTSPATYSVINSSSNKLSASLPVSVFVDGELVDDQSEHQVKKKSKPGGYIRCEHGRQRAYCKECGGSRICPHARQKPSCKECKGNQICEHQRIRARCKECGGKSICPHNRIRTNCRECGGAGICQEHGRQRSKCKDCLSARECEHGVLRRQCKECLRVALCEHEEQPELCKQCLVVPVKASCSRDGCGNAACKSMYCRTLSICEHLKLRSNCTECATGSSMTTVP